MFVFWFGLEKSGSYKARIVALESGLLCLLVETMLRSLSNAGTSKACLYSTGLAFRKAGTVTAQAIRENSRPYCGHNLLAPLG